MSLDLLKNNSINDIKGIYLFGAPGSNNFSKAAMLLEEKGLTWHQESVNLIKYDNFKPEYLKVNPQGSIPAMIHDGVAIYGSENILKYIESIFPEPEFTCNTEAKNTEMWEWVVSSTRTHLETAIGIVYKNKGGRPIRKNTIDLYKKHNPNKLKFIQERGYHMTKHQEQEILDINHAKLRMLENRLSKSTYIMGNKVTVADIAWMPDIAFISELGFDISSYQHVKVWFAKMSKRPSWNKRTLIPGKALRLGGYYLRLLSKSKKYLD